MCGLGASTETCTYACISTLYMSLPYACTFPTHAFPHGHTYNNSCVDGVLAKTHAPTLLKKRAQFLYLTSKLKVSPKTNEEQMGFLSLLRVFTQPIFPKYPLCAGPDAQCRGGRHRLGLSPASQEHPRLLGRGGPRARHRHCQESAWDMQAQSRLPTPASGVKLPVQLCAPPGSWTCLQLEVYRWPRLSAGPGPLPDLLTVEAPAQHR